MNAEYWAVGASSPSPLPLTPADISKHLVADWVPSVPASLSKAMMGWPVHLMAIDRGGGTDYVTLSEEARGGERQWNGVLSWMMGVAGTRHVLEQEGYRWVAPMSAFYPEAKQNVNLSAWHPRYPRSSILAEPNAAVTARLRPDYIALRPGASGSTHSYEWAVVESKGVGRQLSGLVTCPLGWRRQAENAILREASTRRKILVPRHLVVATRCNPNAARSRTRRVQIRAWNDERAMLASDPVLAEVASAHLFGVCRNLGLRENAIALALAAEARGRTGQRLFGDRRYAAVLDQVRRADINAAEEFGAAEEYGYSRQIESDFGAVNVRLEEPTVRLISRLRVATDPEEAAQAVSAADEELDNQRASRSERLSPGRARSSAGIVVTLPRLLE